MSLLVQYTQPLTAVLTPCTSLLPHVDLSTSITHERGRRERKGGEREGKRGRKREIKIIKGGREQDGRKKRERERRGERQ